MSHTRTHASIWAKPSQGSLADGGSHFHVAFRLGPYQLARATVDVDIVDLGDIAVSGDGADLAHLCGRQLFIKSVPHHLSLASLSQDGQALIYPFYGYDRCWVATEGDFEAYLATFSKTSRKGLRRRVKQLTSASGGALDIRHYAQIDVMAAFHADARAVSAKTFQEKLMSDGLPDGDAFRRDMVEKVQRDQCYGSILYLDDIPISYLYCEKRGGGWLAVYGGFDPAHAKLSPGTVHLISVLENSFKDRDCKLFDFGPGRSDYKQFFATHTVPCSDILILEKSWRNRLIVDTHRALGRLTKCGISLADSLRLKEVLRQKIRGR